MKASFLDVGSGEHLDIPLSFNDSTPSSAPSVGSIDIDQFKVE